jgi:cytidyltransferase-like protein
MSKLTGREKKILAKIYASQFSRDESKMDALAFSLETDKTTLQQDIRLLQRRGLVALNGTRPRLTTLGRRNIVVVMAGGSFDIIHPGHLQTLEQAKLLGDCLIVSIARDSTFRKNKRHEPNHDERLRRKLVSSIRVVDSAVLGSKGDILETAEKLNPDIIALGYDQRHNEAEIKARLAERGLDVRVIRLNSSLPRLKTTTILERRQKDGLLSRL